MTLGWRWQPGAERCQVSEEPFSEPRIVEQLIGTRSGDMRSCDTGAIDGANWIDDRNPVAVAQGAILGSGDEPDPAAAAGGDCNRYFRAASSNICCPFPYLWRHADM